MDKKTDIRAIVLPLPTLQILLNEQQKEQKVKSGEK